MIPLSKGKTDCKDGFTFILIPQCFQGCQTIIQQQILIQQILTGVSTQRQFRKHRKPYIGAQGMQQSLHGLSIGLHIRNLNSRRNTRNMKVSVIFHNI